MLGLSIYPDLGLKAFWLDHKVIFDGSNYLNIARNGYTSWELTAFYPLWPLLLRSIAKVLPESSLVLTGIGIALAMFIASTYLFQKMTKRRFGPYLAGFVTFLYVMNPNSFFHIQLYPESLSALLITVFMYFSEQESRPEKQMDRSIIWPSLFVFALSALSALARPWLPYFVFASLGAWLMTWLLRRDRGALRPTFLTQVLPLSLGAFFGYALYGIFTEQRFGSFWEPFLAQKNWGRDFSMHWSLVTEPKSVGGSDHVLFWDIQAFYLPWLLIGAAALLIGLRRRGTLPQWLKADAIDALATDFLFWFFGLITLGLSLTAFLSYPIFMSLGRHVFTSPPIFYCLGAVLLCFRKPLWFRRTLFLYGVASAVFLVLWATRYSKSSWMG